MKSVQYNVARAVTGPVQETPQTIIYKELLLLERE